MRRNLALVLNDGETYTDLDGCCLVQLPAHGDEDLDPLARGRLIHRLCADDPAVAGLVAGDGASLLAAVAAASPRGARETRAGQPDAGDTQAPDACDPGRPGPRRDADLPGADARLRVSFTVPVEVIVDTHTGEVERVVVVDDALGPVREADGTPQMHKLAPDQDPQPVTEPALRQRAQEILADAFWPAWEFGW
jgi:hypothetical protein